MPNVRFDDWERDRLQDEEFIREVRRQMVVHQFWRLYHTTMAGFWRLAVRALEWWQGRRA